MHNNRDNSKYTVSKAYLSKKRIYNTKTQTIKKYVKCTIYRQYKIIFLSRKKMICYTGIALAFIDEE